MTKQENIRRQRFERVATRRVQRAIDVIGLIANCSTRTNYEYSQEDVDYMFSALQKALDEAHAAFKPSVDKRVTEKFSLPRK